MIKSLPFKELIKVLPTMASSGVVADRCNHHRRRRFLMETRCVTTPARLNLYNFAPHGVSPWLLPLALNGLMAIAHETPGVPRKCCTGCFDCAYFHQNL